MTVKFEHCPLCGIETRFFGDQVTTPNWNTHAHSEAEWRDWAETQRYEAHEDQKVQDEMKGDDGSQASGLVR